MAANNVTVINANGATLTTLLDISSNNSSNQVNVFGLGTSGTVTNTLVDNISSNTLTATGDASLSFYVLGLLSTGGKRTVLTSSPNAVNTLSSGLNISGSLTLPVSATANPGSFAYNSTSNQFIGGLTSGTVIFPTFTGTPSSGNCVAWGSNGTLADAMKPCPVTWDSIVGPAGNQSLSMQGHSSTWTWGSNFTGNAFNMSFSSGVTGTGDFANINVGNASGSNNVLSITDAASNTGAGYLLAPQTANGSGTTPILAGNSSTSGTITGIDVLQQSAATASVNNNSPLLRIIGRSWSGSGSDTKDSWSVQNRLAASGLNPASTLTFSHSGSTGLSLVQLPTLQVVPSSGTTAIQASTAGSSLIVTGGQDSASAAQGSLTVRGGSILSGSGAVSAGNAILTGGSTASSSTSSIAGNAQIIAGGAGNGGNNGIVQIIETYNAGASVAANKLVCLSGISSKTVFTCPANATNWIGVALNTTTPVQVVVAGEVLIVADGTVTLGHQLCVSATGGEVHDNGGTSACSSVGLGVGIVESKTEQGAGSSLPLVALRPY